MVVVPSTRSTGRYCQVMAQSAIDKIPLGPKLDELTAEKVFGWKNVHKHEGSLVGKKQIRLGIGGDNAKSIFNKYGKYGNPFSHLSPFNEFSRTPPRLMKNDK